LSLLLVVDVVLRYRSARLGINSIAEWRGLLPFPLLALLGGIASIVAGWVAWCLVVLSVLAASETFKMPTPPDDPEKTQSINQLMSYTRNLQVSLLFVFEVVTTAVLVRTMLQLSYKLLLESF
jgi:hypothetical protein